MIQTIARNNIRSARSCTPIHDSRYSVSIAETANDIESALRLRFEVFTRELSGGSHAQGAGGLEFDSYDFNCDHLIVRENSTGRTVGTYRMNSIEMAARARGFYSHGEFTIEDLPNDILASGVELGRACVARDHRNSKVLFLLWRGVAAYLRSRAKRYVFGCCSIFSLDPKVGESAYKALYLTGNVHDTLSVRPRANAVPLGAGTEARPDVGLPNLFQMYLKMGAKVCGPPMMDSDFGTIDFFVVLDTENLSEKYRRSLFD